MGREKEDSKKGTKVFVEGAGKLWQWLKSIDSWVQLFKESRQWVILFLSVCIVVYLLKDIAGQVSSALHINLVELSATLGGLVFTGASFTRKGTPSRKSLMMVAKLFITSAFLFIIFYFLFTLIQDVNFTNAFDFSKDKVGITLTLWLAIIGIYGGSAFFASALVNLIICLRKIT